MTRLVLALALLGLLGGAVYAQQRGGHGDLSLNLAPDLQCADGQYPDADGSCSNGSVIEQPPVGEPVYVEPEDGDVSCGMPDGFPCPIVCSIYSRDQHRWSEPYPLADCAPQ